MSQPNPLIGVLLLTVAACGGGDGGTSSSASTIDTTEAAVTTTDATGVTASTAGAATDPADPITIDEGFLADQVAKSWDPDLPGAVMVVVHDADGGVVHASSGTDPEGRVPTPSDQFRIGSITKLLTAVTVMTLVDDGLVDLDTPANHYLSRINLDGDATVRDLLQHTSGVPDLTSAPGFIDELTTDMARVWAPEEVVDVGQAREPLFEPGELYSYSNTNYVALGVLIEELTDLPFHTAVRDRIIEPLGLDDTYLGWHEPGPEPFGAYSMLLGPLAPIDEGFDYTATETISWASGATISTAGDLHRLYSALFDGEVISDASLAEMTTESDFPLGLAIDDWGGESPLWGQDGRIWGYGTWAVHAPDTGSTVFTVSTADHLKVTPATRPVALAIAGEHSLG